MQSSFEINIGIKSNINTSMLFCYKNALETLNIVNAIHRVSLIIFAGEKKQKFVTNFVTKDVDAH